MARYGQVSLQGVRDGLGVSAGAHAVGVFFYLLTRNTMFFLKQRFHVYDVMNSDRRCGKRQPANLRIQRSSVKPPLLLWPVWLPVRVER